jgi:Flp pilus assembly protein TadG
MKSQHIKKIRPHSRGSVLTLVALLLFVFLGIAALSIDIGYLSTTRNELQNVADAAALAGASHLGYVYSSDAYENLSPAERQTFTFARADVVSVIQNVATLNKAAGVDILIDDNRTNNGNFTDVVIGLWNSATLEVDPNLEMPDAVSVIARRDGGANSPISTFFAKIFNIDSVPVSAEAAASLTGPAWVAEGELKLPIGISERLFPLSCTDLISFYPTTDSCAGWHNFYDPINANTMPAKLLGFIEGDTADNNAYFEGQNGTPGRDPLVNNGAAWLENIFDIDKAIIPTETPAAGEGALFQFQGGAIASLFNIDYLGVDYDGDSGTVYKNESTNTQKKDPAAIIALFDYFRYRDGDGDDTVWTSSIPVYEDHPERCENPGKDTKIKFFASIVMISPNPPPATDIKVHMTCEPVIIEGRGGGVTNGNLKGTIPSLVK